jgi:hypothetical protein
MAVGNAHLYAKCPVFIGDDTIRRFGMGVCCLASAHDSLTIGNHLNQQHLTRGDSEKRSAAIVSLSTAARVARSVSVRSAGIHYPPERALCRRRDALALPLRRAFRSAVRGFRFCAVFMVQIALLRYWHPEYEAEGF